jgi:hypothetical protein
VLAIVSGVNLADHIRRVAVVLGERAGADDFAVILLDDPSPLVALSFVDVELDVDLGARDVCDDPIAAPSERDADKAGEDNEYHQHDRAVGITKDPAHLMNPPLGIV